MVYQLTGFRCSPCAIHTGQSVKGAVSKAIINDIVNCFRRPCLHGCRSQLPEAEESELGLSYAEKSDLLAISDAATLHLPFTKETYAFMERQAFTLMQPGSVFINVSASHVGTPAELEAELSSVWNRGEGGTGSSASKPFLLDVALGKCTVVIMNVR